MVDYLNEQLREHQCGDAGSNSNFSLEFSTDSMEGGFHNPFKKKSKSDTNTKLNFTVISDPEGYDILKQADFDPKDTDKQLYICGDILDSTGDIGIKIFTNQTPPPKDSVLKVGDIDDLHNKHNLDKLNAKSHNLKNIQTCLKHSNIHLIFGNRDLNKLKCKFLCVLENNKSGYNEFITKFNEGNINLTSDDYNKLYGELGQNKKPWKINGMKNWSPFWINKFYEERKEYTEKKVFKERFDEIFGQDGTIGTMSAQNLLYTIPFEISKYMDVTKDIVFTNENNDFRAFIVLAVFRSMCLNYDDTQKDEIHKTNSKNYKGWLTGLYQKGCIMKIIEDTKSIYILSHGGMTYNGFRENYFDELKNFIYDNHNHESQIKEYFTKLINIITNQTGGFCKDDTKTSYSSDVIKKLEELNKIYTEAITKVLEQKDMNIPDRFMIFLLMTTAPYTCEKINKDKLLNCKEIEKSILSSELVGPVVPGIKNMRTYMFTCSDKTLYQIIGHIPNGYGATIDKFKNNYNSNFSYLITLDNSNSFVGTNQNKVEKFNSLSKTMFTVKDNVTYINTTIALNDNIQNKIYNSEINHKKLPPEHNDIVYHSLKYKKNKIIIINNKINDIDKYITMTHKEISIQIPNKDNKLVDVDTFISYHGYFKIYLTKYHVITHTYDGFNKVLFILNDSDFKNYISYTKELSTKKKSSKKKRFTRN